MPADVWDFFRQHALYELRQFYWAAVYLYGSPWFLGSIVGILAWERLQPAVSEQPLVTPGVAEDSIWLNIELASRAILVPPLAAGFAVVYRGVSGGATVSAVAAWPTALRIALALLIFDFLEYAAHWVRHRINVLWRFHEVHHSQRQLNLFSASRSHVGEYVVLAGLVTAPMVAFGLDPFAIVGVGMGVGLQARLVHSNIRSNFGVMGLLFVNPQFHRMHHSIEPEHANRNFGLILTIWDRMFGTAWPDRTCYPATGVPGVEIAPRDLRPVEVVRAVWSELLQPFRRRS